MAGDKKPTDAGGIDAVGRAANDDDPPSAGPPDMQDNRGDFAGGPYAERDNTVTEE